MACANTDAGAPVITSISPPIVDEGKTAPLTISGRNFLGTTHVDLSSRRNINIDQGFQVLLGTGPTAATGVTHHSSESLSCDVPSTLTVGMHEVMVITPSGLRAISPVLLEVRARNVAGGSGGSGGMPVILASGGAPSGSMGGASSLTGGANGIGAGGSLGVGGSLGAGGTGGSLGMGGSLSSGGSGGGMGSTVLLGSTQCTKLPYGAGAYLFCRNENVTQIEGKQLCESIGMKLPQPDSAQEQQFLFSNAQALGIEEAYLGASDQANEGVWIWEDNQQFWQGGKNGFAFGNQYNHWHSGEPSAAAAEDCSIVDILNQGAWYDRGCGYTSVDLVCEAP